MLGGYEIAGLSTEAAKEFSDDLWASYQCQGGIKEMMERWPAVMKKNSIAPMPKPAGARMLQPDTDRCKQYFQLQAVKSEMAKLYS